MIDLKPVWMTFLGMSLVIFSFEFYLFMFVASPGKQQSPVTDFMTQLLTLCMLIAIGSKLLDERIESSARIPV
jgi:hypothetical protein